MITARTKVAEKRLEFQVQSIRWLFLMNYIYTSDLKIRSVQNRRQTIQISLFLSCVCGENRTKQNNPQLNCLQSPCDDKWYLFSELLGAHRSPATTAAAHLQHADANCPLFKHRLTSGSVSPRARLICSAQCAHSTCLMRILRCEPLAESTTSAATRSQPAATRAVLPLPNKLAKQKTARYVSRRTDSPGFWVTSSTHTVLLWVTIVCFGGKVLNDPRLRRRWGRKKKNPVLLQGRMATWPRNSSHKVQRKLVPLLFLASPLLACVSFVQGYTLVMVAFHMLSM